MILRYSFLILTFLLAGQAFAQKIKVTGRITDKGNIPLEHVIVSQENTTNGTYSDRDGRYELQLIKQDSIKLSFSLLGYKNQQHIFLSAPQAIEVDITLSKTDHDLSEVSVSGSRSSIFIRNYEFLNSNRPSNPWNSLEAMLSTVGGVSSTNELSSQYSVRGGNFDENIVYINGIEIYRPLLVRSAQQEGLSFINPNMVENVGFSAGGFSSEYGDKMSSVLDITYKKPKKFEGAVSASMMGGDLYIGSSNNRYSQTTGIRYKTTRSLLNTTDTKAEFDPSFIDAQTFITYNFSPKWELNLLGNYSHNSYEFTPASRETTFGTYMNPKTFLVHFNGWEKDLFKTYQLAMTLKGKVTDQLTLGLSGSTFHSDEQEKYDIEGRYELKEAFTGETSNNNFPLGIGTYHEHARNRLDADVYTLSHFGNYRLSKHLIKWGISIQNEKIKDHIKEWEMRDSTGYSIPSNGIEVNLFSSLKSDNKISSNRFSGFIQDSYNFEIDKGTFILNAGVRASYWDLNKETIISPRGALIFFPNAIPDLSFKISGGIYYQAPFYKELQYIIKDQSSDKITLNKDIKSQKSIHLVVGSDYYFGGNTETQTPPFKLSGEIFYKKLSDLIPYTVNNVKIRYTGQNIADGHIVGIDATLYGEFIPNADSWISLSFMKSEQDINGIKLPLPTDQRFNLALFYQDYFPAYERLRMSLRGVWSQGLPVSPPYSGYENGYFRTPAYKRVDLGFAWQILGEDFKIRNTNSFCAAFKNIWLGLDLFNLFDMQNTNTYYWVADVHNMQHAVPNYLTGRQINIKLLADF